MDWLEIDEMKNINGNSSGPESHAELGEIRWKANKYLQWDLKLRPLVKMLCLKFGIF